MSSSLLRPLTQREKQVLALLVKGDRNKTIGVKLGCTEATAKIHVKHLLMKLGVENRTQAVTWLFTHLDEILDPPKRPVPEPLPPKERTGWKHLFVVPKRRLEG